MPEPTSSRGNDSISSACSSARIGAPAAMSPTTGTVTVFSVDRPGAEPVRNGRTSSCRVIDPPRRRKPLSSKAFRCFDTVDVDRSPTASAISRVLGGHPCPSTQSRIVSRIRC